MVGCLEHLESVNPKSRNNRRSSLDLWYAKLSELSDVYVRYILFKVYCVIAGQKVSQMIYQLHVYQGTMSMLW